jgi:hypothetical protein
MGVRIRKLQERVRSASLPWPVLVALGGAVVALLLASRATTAAAADPGVAPAPPVQQAGQAKGLLPIVNDTVGRLLPPPTPPPATTTAPPTPPPASAPQSAPDTAPALVPQVIRPVVAPVVKGLTAAPGAAAPGVAAPGAAAPAPVAPSAASELSHTSGLGLPIVERPAADLLTPVLATACGVATTVLDPTVGAVDIALRPVITTLNPLLGLDGPVVGARPAGSPPTSSNGPATRTASAGAARALAGVAASGHDLAVRSRSASARAIGPGPSDAPTHLPTVPGAPALPAAAVCAAPAPVAPSSTAFAMGAGLLVLLSTSRVRPESPAPLRQAGVVSLIERPG